MARERKKSGFFGKFIAATLGFVTGVVATVGGIGGAGYYIIAQMPIKDGVNTVGGWTGASIDYKEYIAEEFASNSILGAVTEISKFVEEIGAGTASLSSLEKFTPFVSSKVSELLPTLTAYGVPVDLNTLMSTPFTQLHLYAAELIDNTEIGKVAGSYLGGVGDGILKTLSYGEENFEHIMEDIDGDGNADISMLGNNKPTLVKDLVSSDLFSGVLGNISVASLMQNAGTDQLDDMIFRSVLYGEENVDYIVVGDTVQMLPRAYTYDPVSGAFKDMESEQVFHQDGSDWKNATLGYTISPNAGEYSYAVTDADGATVELLKETATPNAYEVYRTSQLGTAVLQLNRGMTLGELLSDGFDAMELLYKINVGDLLDLDGSSPSMLLSVAYGKEGEDYTVDPATNEILPITEPTKIGDLMDVTKLTEKLYDLYLADLMDNISPLDPNADNMTILLAYGEEGVHYQLVDTDSDGTADTIEWLQYTDASGTHYYTKRTIGDLIASGGDIFSGISVASILNVNTDSTPLLINLAYGPSSRYTIENNKFVMSPIRFAMIGGVAYDDLNAPYDGQDGNGSTTDLGGGVYKVQNWMSTYYISEDGGVYYAYATQDDAAAGLANTRLTYQKVMLSSLRGSEAGLFLENIELGTALGITPTSTDKMMVALAYGYNGEQFTISGTEVTWNTNPATGLPYRPRTLKDLKNAKDIISTIKIADFIQDDSNPLLNTFAEKGWTINDLTPDNINSLQLGEVLMINDTDLILSALKTAKIGELETEIKKLTIHQLLGDHAETNRFIRHIKDTPIGEIEQAMENLTVIEIFDDKVYKTEVVDGTTYYFDAANPSNRLYFNAADGNYYQDAAFTQVAERALTGCWKYMLSDPESHKTHDEYTFNDFDALMHNMTANMETASLQDLSADDVLHFEGVDMSQTTLMGISINDLLVYSTGDATRTESTLGELSLLDLLTIVVNNENLPNFNP